MRSFWTTGSHWVVAAEICSLVGCANPGTELDLTTYDRLQDQRKIAEVYSQEAGRLRYLAQDLSSRATVYEHVFGPDSDWVRGARLLAQSYLDAARDHERKAERHHELSHDRQTPQAR